MILIPQKHSLRISDYHAIDISHYDLPSVKTAPLLHRGLDAFPVLLTVIIRRQLEFHSAGAHLVALLAAAPAKVQALGTVSLDSAVMDVTGIMQKNHYRFYDKAFGKDAAYWRAASPLAVLTSDAKPMLLVCSSVRRDQPCAQARTFAAKAAGLGVRSEVSEQALSHKDINRTLGLPGAYTEAVETFMASLDGSVRKLLAGAK